MKFWLTTLLIIGFIAITIFGSFAMNHDSTVGHNKGCIAQTLQGTECPKKEEALSFLNFHLGAFRIFLTATLFKNLAGYFILLIALLFVSVFEISKINHIKPTPVRNHSSEQSLESFFLSQRHLIHWLTLHENSPSLQ